MHSTSLSNAVMMAVRACLDSSRLGTTWVDSHGRLNESWVLVGVEVGMRRCPHVEQWGKTLCISLLAPCALSKKSWTVRVGVWSSLDHFLCIWGDVSFCSSNFSSFNFVNISTCDVCLFVPLASELVSCRFFPLYIEPMALWIIVWNPMAISNGFLHVASLRWILYENWVTFSNFIQSRWWTLT